MHNGMMKWMVPNLQYQGAILEIICPPVLFPAEQAGGGDGERMASRLWLMGSATELAATLVALANKPSSANAEA